MKYWFSLSSRNQGTRSFFHQNQQIYRNLCELPLSMRRHSRNLLLPFTRLHVVGHPDMGFKQNVSRVLFVTRI